LFPNARIVGGRAIQHPHAAFKKPSVSNAMALTSQNITENLHGATKPTKRQILLN